MELWEPLPWLWVRSGLRFGLGEVAVDEGALLGDSGGGPLESSRWRTGLWAVLPRTEEAMGDLKSPRSVRAVETTAMRCRRLD